MQSEERLLPTEAIRRDHATANEITRHRITSFRFVEHGANVGQGTIGCKTYCKSRTASPSLTGRQGRPRSRRRCCAGCAARAAAGSRDPRQAILRDDGEAAAAARFRDRQLDIADREPAADPLGFGETAFDRRHVDDDVRPETARSAAPSGCSAPSRASEAVVSRWIGDTL